MAQSAGEHNPEEAVPHALRSPDPGAAVDFPNASSCCVIRDPCSQLSVWCQVFHRRGYKPSHSKAHLSAPQALSGELLQLGRAGSATPALHPSPKCEQRLLLPLGSAPSASAPRCYSALFPDRELSRISRSSWGCQEESSPVDLIIKALSAVPDFRTIAAWFPKHWLMRQSC